jgi:hypothetical protein
MNTPADVRGSRLLAERSSCHVIKRLPSRRRRENNVGGGGVSQKATGRDRRPDGFSGGLKLLGADPQSFVIQGADWHARCLKKRPNHNEAVEPG